jgi:hypothetical protein
MNSRPSKTSKYIVRRLYLFISLLITLAGLNACESVGNSDSPELFVGMSSQRLKLRFGEPLRIERSPAGEDWYYSFASRRSPDTETSAFNDGLTRSSSTSMTFSNEKNIQECPIHISLEGFVSAPLPAGKIVAR